MQCGICYDEASAGIICPSCGYNACKTCLGQYFSTQKELNCPSCHVVFTREFLSKEMPSFLKTYKEMREKLLLDQEMARMIETQDDVKREKRKRKATEELNIAREEMKKLKARIQELRDHSHVLENIIHNDYAYETGAAACAAPKEDAARVVCKCPVADCRGYVTSAEYKCGLCSVTVCRKCMMVKEEQHECKKEDVESAELIKKSSKPCPKCAAPIFKIDGCDQMWCTQCKTAFSWITGRIETGKVHNPHFFEWQRKIHNGEAPRVEGDEPPRCGGQLLTIHQIFDMLPRNTDETTKLIRYFNYMEHIRGVERAPQPIDNKALRVKFLLGDIDERRLALRVQQVDKLHQKNTEVYQVFETIAEGSMLIFTDMRVQWRLSPARFHEQLSEYITRFQSLIEFADRQMVEIATKYQMTTPCPSEQLFRF